MECQSLQSLLESAAEARPSNGLIIYPSGNPSTEIKLSYSELLDKSRSYSALLRLAHGFGKRLPVLIYLDNQLDTLVWFWATLFADAIPVVLPQLSNIPEQRHKHIQSLDHLLDRPVWITSSRKLDFFDGQDGLNLLTLETMLSWSNSQPQPSLSKAFWDRQKYEGDAMFMLTSGSTGAPKAVRLNHQQVIASVNGKLAVRELPAEKAFLNWIGLDHVASITEIHLTAMRLGVDQVHVTAVDVISDPLLFVDLLSRHQVSRTFAPNFFLAKLAETVQARSDDIKTRNLDLRHLTWLGSGGEANDVEVCAAVSKFTSEHGARSDVVVPGFGMTETSAGSIYHLQCPSYDVQGGTSFTSLGKCMPGIEMRVSRNWSDLLNGSDNDHQNEGNLEVRGAVIFEGYYNNPSATAEVFTPDGWFQTGDKAMIDSCGNLHLVGRAKETMIINGVKHFPHDVENILSHVLARQVSRVVCFSHRPASSRTEQICILYVLAQDNDGLQHGQTITDTHDKIVRTVMLHTGVRPYVVSLTNEADLQVSTLGKVSRVKMRSLLQSGFFSDRAKVHEAAVQGGRSRNSSSSHTNEPALNQDESALLDDFYAILSIAPNALGPETPIFEVGVTSMEIIQLKKRIGKRLGIEVPVVTILSNPTARSMATSLQRLVSSSSVCDSGSSLASDTSSDLGSTSSLVTSQEYNPVITLRHEGDRTPLWLVHPGVGEILVFLGLSKHIDDRPVYALRARGFDGHAYFTSIEETVNTYHHAIKKQQPHGPYAIAGYSFGAMLAFEICKRLESGVDPLDSPTPSQPQPRPPPQALAQPSERPDDVRFFGSFNLPPHIKTRMQQLNWNECLLHLCFFLDLISQDTAESLSPDLVGLSADAAFSYVFSLVDRTRLSTLSLDPAGLRNWASLAHNMQGMAVDYEPGGKVNSIDVFHAEPLKVVASGRKEWVEKHLRRWDDFCLHPTGEGQPQEEEEKEGGGGGGGGKNRGVRFHRVDGAHYTMLNPDHVGRFATVLKQAMRNRGV